MSILFLALMFTYINSPMAEMRQGPSSTEKVNSQAIHSEKVEMLETKGDWIKIKTPDTYVGWVNKSHLCHVENPFLENNEPNVAVVYRKAAHLYHTNDTEYGPIKTLPFESKLEVIDNMGNPNGRWIKVRLVDNTEGFIQRGDVRINPTFLPREEIVALSKQFFDLPYTWGGRTSFGYDCSGFVQMLYRQMGYRIPRDSCDQAAWEGFHKISVEEAQPTDLVFFSRANGRVFHVGMCIGNNEFIHSTVAENSPCIRVSKLNNAPWGGNGDFFIHSICSNR